MIPRRKLTIGAIQVGAAVALFAGVAGAAVTTGQVLGIGSGSGSEVEVVTNSAGDNRNSATSTTVDDKGGLRDGHSSDDRPLHDSNHDKSGLRSDHGRHGSDD